MSRRPPSAPRGSEGHPRAIEEGRASASPESAGDGALVLDTAGPNQGDNGAAVSGAVVGCNHRNVDLTTGCCLKCGRRVYHPEGAPE